MGIFGRKKDKIIDLTESYNLQKRSPVRVPRKSQEVAPSSSETEDSGSGSFFGGFFGEDSDNPSSGSQIETYGTERIHSSRESSYGRGVDAEEKRRRLAKRLQTMTEKIEDLSNQIYHLQQRIELVEKKLNIRDY